jgi:hypothetical protein
MRAQITLTGFINEYHFGSFKGDKDTWMDMGTGGAINRYPPKQELRLGGPALG